VLGGAGGRDRVRALCRERLVGRVEDQELHCRAHHQCHPPTSARWVWSFGRTGGGGGGKGWGGGGGGGVQGGGGVGGGQGMSMMV